MNLHFRWKPKTRKQLVLILGGIALFAFLLTFYIVQAVAFAIWNGINNGNAWKFGLGSILKYSVQVRIHWGAILFCMFIVIAMIFAIFMSNRKQLLHDDRNFDYSDSHEYGSAGLATEEELKGIAKISSSKKALGNIFGQIDDTGKRVLEFDITSHGNKNICVFGAAGSGKTYCMVKPNMLQAVRRHESIIVTDPKGELYRDTVSYLRSKGYHIGVFNLSNPGLSDGWDCLKELYDQNGNLDPLRADIFAATVIANLGGDITSGDIYVKGSQALLKSILLRVLEGNDYDDSLGDPRHSKTIGAAYRFLVEHGAPEALEAEFDNEDPAAGHSELDQASYAYKIFATTSQNLHGNIVTTLSTNLQAFQNEVICKLTGTNNLDLTLPGKERCAYFLILPDQHDTYRFLSSLFFTYLFIDLVELADSQVTGRLKVPVNLIMDEFVNIGTIPDFDKKIATVRSREIRTMMILQDITQLQNYYERSWQSIMSNCTTWVGLGFNDLETASYFEKRSGVATISVVTETHQKAEAALTIFRRKNVGSGKRQVMNADELLRMPSSDALVVFQNRNVLQLKKFPIVSHPDMNLNSPEWTKCNVVDDCLSIMDEAGRKERHDQEIAFITKYNAEHPEDCEPISSYTADDDMENEKKGKKSVVDKAKERAKASRVEVVSREEVDSLFGEKRTSRSGFDNVVDVDYDGQNAANPFGDAFNPFQKTDAQPEPDLNIPTIAESSEAESNTSEMETEPSGEIEVEPTDQSSPAWAAVDDDTPSLDSVQSESDHDDHQSVQSDFNRVENTDQKQNKNKRKRKGNGSGQRTDGKPVKDTAEVTTPPTTPPTPGAARVTPGGVVRPPTPGAAVKKDIEPPMSTRDSNDSKNDNNKTDYTGNANISFGMGGMPPGF